MRQDLDATLTQEQLAALRNVIPDEHPGECGFYEGLRALTVVIYARQFGEYQGDNVAVVLSDNNEVGLLVSYFGSCSGCDPLQACDTADEVVAYYADQWRKIRWFSTLAELITYCDDDDRKLQFGDDVDLHAVAEDLCKQRFGKLGIITELRESVELYRPFWEKRYIVQQQISSLEFQLNAIRELLKLADAATRAVNEHPQQFTSDAKRAALLYVYKRAQFKEETGDTD